MSAVRTAAIDLIQAYYEAFNAKDWDGMVSCVGDNIHHDVNEGGVRGGKEKFRAFLVHMDTCYDETLTDLQYFANDAGTRGAAEFIVNGTYKETDGDLPQAKGQTYRLPAGAFFEFDNCSISRVTTYYNLSNWIEQVG